MKTDTISLLIWVAVWVVGAVGWGMNISKLAQADAFTGLTALRAVGIFVGPLGAVLGYF